MAKQRIVWTLVLIAVMIVLLTADESTAKKPVAKTPPPRIRREWRTLSVEMRQKMANAFWTLKNTSTMEGRAKYGPHFNNHDELIMAHACAVYDPRCDQGHFASSFMTFHRAFLLKYELALLSVDPSVQALPYWNIANDATGGLYRNNPDKYIYTDNFFGDFFTNASNGYAVSNGLFANWPVALYTADRFGNTSWLAKDNRCIREQWFVPTPCDANNKSSTVYLRDHHSCSKYVSRNPLDNSMNAQKKLGGSYEIVYTPADFKVCADTSYIHNWMDWQNCIELGTLACSPRVQSAVVKHATAFDTARMNEWATKASGDPLREASLEQFEALVGHSIPPVPPNNFTCNTTNFLGSYIAKGKVQLVNFFHSMVHLKNGLDMLDVTTSPNDAASFTGYHANIDRNNMIWQQHVSLSVQRKYWGYPRTVSDTSAKGQSPVTTSGPFSTYDLGICAGDPTAFYDYKPFESAWLPGTVLDDVVNSGFPFQNLFPCVRDTIDASGHHIRCNATEDGYTHREILYWTAPQRTPYIYDVMVA